MKKTVLLSLVAASFLFGGEFYLGGKKVDLEPSEGIQTRSLSIGTSKVKYYKLGEKKVGVTNRILLKFKSNQDISNVEKAYNIKYVKSLKKIKVFEAVSPEAAMEASKKMVDDGVVIYANPEFTRTIKQHDLNIKKPVIKKSSIKANYVNPDSLSNIDDFGNINPNKYYDTVFFFDPSMWWDIYNAGDTTVYVYDSSSNSLVTDTSVADVDSNILEAWSDGYTGKGIRVGIIDDGFQMDHPDLQFAYTYNVATESRNVNPNNWTFSHGTGTASVIAGKSQNGYAISGISPDVELVAVSGLFNVNSDQLTEKYIEAIQIMQDQNVRIVNCSFETDGVVNDALRDAIHTLSTTGGNGKGTLIVYASGNAGVSTPNDESQLLDVVSVGAVEATGKRVEYSNYGQYLDFVAPTHFAVLDLVGDHDGDGEDDGESNGELSYCTGTSYSAPYFTASAALILQANPELTRDELLDVMARNSKKVGGYEYTINNSDNMNQYNDKYTWNSEMGYGIVDVKAAIDEVKVDETTTVSYTQEDIDNAINETIAGCQANPESCGITPLKQIVTEGFVNNLPVGWSNVGNSMPIYVTDMDTIFASAKMVYVYQNGEWYAWAPDDATQLQIANSTNVKSLVNEVNVIGSNSGIWVLK